MRLLKIAAVAKDDLNNIGEFIRRDDPVRAVTFVAELATRIEVVAERPLSFPARPEIAPNVRSSVYGNYLILFRVSDEDVVILRVVHGARDLDHLL